MNSMFYGTIAARSNAASHLKSLGVQLGDYDYKKNVFYVRASAAVLKSVAEFNADYVVDVVERLEDENFGGVRSYDGLGKGELSAELAYLNYLINSERNDGRLSPDSSAWLDLWMNDAEIIRERLEQVVAGEHADNQMQITRGQFNRTVEMFVAYAKDALDVDFDRSAFWVYGSESAINRLAERYKHNPSPQVTIGFSETFQSHYFRLHTPGIIGEMSTRPDVAVHPNKSTELTI